MADRSAKRKIQSVPKDVKHRSPGNNYLFRNNVLGLLFFDWRFRGTEWWRQ